MNNKIECRVCGFVGDIDEYEPTLSMWSDCRCPRCRSTDNQHNSDYQKDLSASIAKMNKEEEEKKKQ